MICAASDNVYVIYLLLTSYLYYSICFSILRIILSHLHKYIQGVGMGYSFAEKQKYYAYLTSPEWSEYRERRKAVNIRRYGRLTCERCYRTDLKLHLHHRTYANIFRELIDDTIFLCPFCHAACHPEKVATPPRTEWESILREAEKIGRSLN